MDALIISGFVLAVLALTLCFVLAGVVAYVLYRYVAVPWKVMRTDMTALAGKMRMVEEMVNRADVMSHSDADVARIEARLNARQRSRMGETR